MNPPLFGIFNQSQEFGPLQAVRDADSAECSLRVLVVEDNAINREVVRRMLDKRGHLVVSVNDGAHGLSEWQQGNYDLILMDLQMPVMDGATATRRIREEEKTRGGHVPIIALTAHAMRGTEKECLACGMDGYISKPLRRESFLKVVESVAGLKCSNASKPTKMAARPLAVTSYTVSAEPDLINVTEQSASLIKRENMAELSGYDVELQQKILHVCAEALSSKLPQLNRAISKGDRTAIQGIAHYLRGSLGMLGLPTLVKIGEEIECRYEVLGAEVWEHRCEEFRALLNRLDRELRHLRAA